MDSIREVFSESRLQRLHDMAADIIERGLQAQMMGAKDWKIINLYCHEPLDGDLDFAKVEGLPFRVTSPGLPVREIECSFIDMLFILRQVAEYVSWMNLHGPTFVRPVIDGDLAVEFSYQEAAELLAYRGVEYPLPNKLEEPEEPEAIP